uniref:Uncharacterized protein n=1 Tax=viral metagenome TaxID=1070528 RepID=A0A6H1ZNK9_9ZZZZ
MQQRPEETGAMSNGLTTPRPIVRPNRYNRERLKKRAGVHNTPVLWTIPVDLAGKQLTDG